jgi:hypothetical protein
VCYFRISFLCAIGEGTEPPSRRKRREASHIPNCATPRYWNLFCYFVALLFCYLVRLVREPNRRLPKKRS